MLWNGCRHGCGVSLQRLQRHHRFYLCSSTWFCHLEPPYGETNKNCTYHLDSNGLHVSDSPTWTFLDACTDVYLQCMLCNYCPIGISLDFEKSRLFVWVLLPLIGQLPEIFPKLICCRGYHRRCYLDFNWDGPSYKCGKFGNFTTPCQNNWVEAGCNAVAKVANSNLS